MKAPTKRGIKIVDEVFNATVFLYIGIPPKEMAEVEEDKKRRKKRWAKASDLVGRQWMWYDANDSPRFGIWVKDADDVKTAIHECVHLAMAILNDRDANDDGNGIDEETLAYYIDFWCGKILPYMKNPVKRFLGLHLPPWQH